MKVTSVVGARPQFVKLAPISQAFENAGIEHKIVHTGQHYDPLMSDVFFDDLKIPQPDVHLGIGSGSHGEQTGAMLAALDQVFTQNDSDWILVYGDTNSTLAAAIAAVKLHIPLAHLEAGLRSFNRKMPEEHNRVLTDHAANLLLAPTEIARDHLESEGLADKTVVVGDVMTDICLQVRDLVMGHGPWIPPGLSSDTKFHVATIHRADNTDDEDQLRGIVRALQLGDTPNVLMVHPRLAARAEEFGIDLTAGSLIPIEPLPYPEMIAAIIASSGVVTDSGGLQKEAYLLDTMCTTVRTETEWVETLHDGWNVLVSDLGQLQNAIARLSPTKSTLAPYGDGHAAEEVAATLSKTATINL